MRGKQKQTWSFEVDQRVPWRPKLGGHEPNENSCSSILSCISIAFNLVSASYNIVPSSQIEEAVEELKTLIQTDILKI